MSIRFKARLTTIAGWVLLLILMILMALGVSFFWAACQLFHSYWMSLFNWIGL